MKNLVKSKWFDSGLFALLVCSLFLFALSGCGIVSSILPSSSEPVVSAPTGVIASTIHETGATLWKFAWLSVLLLLFLPSIRVPLVGLWKALFRLLAIPLVWLEKYLRDKIK